MKAKNRRGSVEPSLDVLGPLQDLIRQFREGKKTKEQLVAFNENRCFCKKKAEAFAPVPLKYDKTKDGWTKLEDVPFDGKSFVPDIVEFLKPNESSVNGEVMKQRAKELGAHLGQAHAEYLLDHQELIPTEWRGKYYLTFAGTVWQDGFGRRFVAYLYWGGDRWYLHFYWLEDVWFSRDRLLRSRG